MKAIVSGARAIQDLKDVYNVDESLFGDHLSQEHFLLVLAQPEWIVLRRGDCHVFLQEHPTLKPVFDLHWYCPKGVKMEDLRALIDWVFYHWPDALIGGHTPPDHPYFRHARTIARALGASPMDNTSSLLTKEMFDGKNKSLRKL